MMDERRVHMLQTGEFMRVTVALSFYSLSQ